MNFLETVGAIAILIVASFIILIIIGSIDNLINKIKEWQSTTIIENGTLFFNHDRKLRITTNKDIKVKFKRKWIVEATVQDKNIYKRGWGINKRAAQNELEKELINLITDEYEDNHYNTYMTENYIENIQEYK